MVISPRTAAHLVPIGSATSASNLAIFRPSARIDFPTTSYDNSLLLTQYRSGIQFQLLLLDPLLDNANGIGVGLGQQSCQDTICFKSYCHLSPFTLLSCTIVASIKFT